ncbi:uncharacterized protein OCT59_010639 [Rhizophagus irregularis]|uniref:Uncharacterized protein n=1 Tax=Rhizophagus irregularis (strain DAOM 181602 / DAOM 197198 / MUCL 43194) TaxID=747089 RepID=A0A2P4P3W3_RHIID|nr:hypothetical protein GLOIN_2v1847788 [Rhizophagus irregularis DAOM 181602=DAOM 197198]POG60072.1 hypothetical protein GLOIN_2v1847788 [Rhizophagus irregularis DAOM 181602=DAOM 197198]UZO19342.1 hypothetical protein OCT59_010639 [Rhizophagus irregularis]GBC13236.2 hypothetical protein GLOIN_2v1847788 [Rhizophagus irregularis DAOM 181602=DAOM 197198]CAG8604228.1 12015_t:CDS:1 [Rhizophagus irregularis]|eukprot:XP_025166938.1 hypothetical protein GLOIN_2v1847788 [Rhizophagus irregularis DAOM 181602=DAOM 197198]
MNMNIQPSTQSNIQMNECNFFHYAPNYDKFYHITYRTLLQGFDSFDDYNYDHGFFYNINPISNYYVMCKILPHSLVANMLNKKIYGIDIGINNLKRKELLSLNQRLDLEQDLKRILPFHLTQNHTSNKEIRMNSSYVHNTQTISITDNHTNFDNSFPQQTRAGCFTNNDINPQLVLNNIPQQIPEGIRCNENTNNVPTTQAVSIADSQNNGFPQPINPLSSSTSVVSQNRVNYNVTNSQQQIDFNNISQHITDREMGSNYYGNLNSFHGNIVNNTPVTQSVLTTDINQNYGNYIQDVNGARNFAYIQQQVDLNNNYRDTDLHNGNIGNNVTTTQTNDHQDINDINQVNNNINNNYRDTDSHNENIENNVTTTQANGLLCDHQDMNDNQQDNHQDNHINNNYKDTDLHNNNIDDNVMTTQTNGLICDHDVNDIHQVTRLQHVDSHHIQHQQ